MLIYFSFFFIVFLFTFLGSQIFGRNNIKAIIIPLILITLFAGLRGNVGTDTFAYKSFFNSIGTDEFNILTFEPFFLFYTFIIKLIWANDQFYIFLISVTTGMLIYYNLKLIEEKSLFFLFYVSFYFIMFNMNLMRFGIGMLLISFPYLRYLRGEKPKNGFFLLGFLTHFTTLFTLIAVIRKKNVVKIILFSGIFLFLIGNLLFSKFKTYLLIAFLTMGQYHLDFGLLFEMGVLSLMLWVNRKGLKRRTIFLFVIYFLLRNFTFFFDMLQRFAYLTGFLIYLNFFYKRQNLYTRLLFILVIAFNVYRSFMFIGNSDKSIEDLIANFPGFSSLYSQTRWLPYKFFWEQ